MGIVNIQGIADSRTAAVFGKIIKEKGGRILIVTPSYIRAERLAGDLSFFADMPVHVLPSDDESFMGYEARNRDTLLERLRVMRYALTEEECVIVAPVQAAIKKMMPADVFYGSGMKIETGGLLDPDSLADRLTGIGYERVPMVYARGQFSLRGDILDIFSPYDNLPVRVEMFDIEVESIRSFDPDTQRSVEKLSSVHILPASLLIRDEAAIERAVGLVTDKYKKLPERRDSLLESISGLSNLQHLEYYIDYFYEDPEYIWQYMDDPLIMIDDPQRAYDNTRARSRELRDDFEVFLEKGLVVRSDHDHFPGLDDYLKLYSLENVILGTPIPRAITGADKYDDLRTVPGHQMTAFNGKLDMLGKEISRLLDGSFKITVVCSSDERITNMDEFLTREGVRDRVWLKKGELTQGFVLPESRICYITDSDIFGIYKARKKRSKAAAAKKAERSAPIRSFADISKGDYVVHEKHGVGRFIGLEQLNVKGETKDYLKVKYQGDDILYVPADQMDLIQRYIGSGTAQPKMNRLSGTEWRNTKAKAKQAIANMAKELLEMSASRKAVEGYRYGPDTVWQKEFEDAFPYEPTADQLKCIDEIKADMQKPAAMDRLLCGDVGYGKTEVAARAIFKAAAEGKQVCVLVPTTILANQHYHTLKDRFEKFPFTVGMLSRFRTDAEQTETIKALSKGTVDVVVGTHRLLSKDVVFKDLGLLIIDEEQRFGVKHKEAIKKMKKNVDVLTLSATPIPRTLHMSLVGIRDMSLIEEPPQDRYPVQTYVMEEDDYIIREALERELDRGGQAFVVYNRVSGVHRIAERIGKLVPGARIGVGHGQMSESALEDVMMDFIEGDIDILVSTTIIESGIDIPNVNTEIIIDADKFGVSQLYQLRGRVGRSNRLAYAYLMHKKNKMLTDVAEQRLRAIKEFTEFGAGFKIAMRDLEIRGAGNILGMEQSGHLVNVGYELYCKLVDDAVKALKGEVVNPERHEATVEIGTSAFIPDTYISDDVLKLTMYKKIAAVVDEEDEKEIASELEDRFGEMPAETRDLIKVARIRALAEKMELAKVSVKGARLILEYPKKTGVKPATILLQKKRNNLAEVIDMMSLMAG